MLIIAKWQNDINIPGYAATLVTICFFGDLQVDQYVWRIFRNTQDRPLSIILRKTSFDD
jgi:hypothetical protein